ncbi:hypothetical protein [Tenacibaculum ovolyticum]|uniref:hypothetical protein n=1 Tax=Tenacibaculum ovolyticum TaxID=104270 RepID=UPI0003FA1849|nr:hypothetical protein [Tenacibaculum ovolyticum]
MKFITDSPLEFMLPLLILLMFILLLFFKGLKNNTEKISNLIKEISLLAIVFGVLCFIIGWLDGLEKIAIALDIAPQVLAGGMRISLYAPTFGLVIFLMGRLGALLLLWKREA